MRRCRRDSGNRGAIAMANYMRGVTTTTLGGYWQAESYFGRVLHRDDEASRQSLIKRFGYDREGRRLAVIGQRGLAPRLS